MVQTKNIINISLKKIVYSWIIIPYIIFYIIMLERVLTMSRRDARFELLSLIFFPIKAWFFFLRPITGSNGPKMLALLAWYCIRTQGLCQQPFLQAVNFDICEISREFFSTSFVCGSFSEKLNIWTSTLWEYFFDLRVIVINKNSIFDYFLNLEIAIGSRNVFWTIKQ